MLVQLRGNSRAHPLWDPGYPSPRPYLRFGCTKRDFTLGINFEAHLLPLLNTVGIRILCFEAEVVWVNMGEVEKMRANRR